jgi:hypothetical protein
MDAADARNWLMTIGFSPTAKPNVWKASERHLTRLPNASIVARRKL